jgi:hypothetical protein
MSYVFMLMTILFVALLDYHGPLYDNITALSGPSFSLYFSLQLCCLS